MLDYLLSFWKDWKKFGGKGGGELQTLFKNIDICNISLFILQADMLMALSTQKASVNDEDLKKLKKFTDDFGMEG